MKENAEGQKLTTSEMVIMSFGLIMVVLYVVLGTTIIFYADRIQFFPKNSSIIFGVFLILYGLFRGYKVYRRYVESKTTDNS